MNKPNKQMNRQEIYQKVSEAITEVLGTPEEEMKLNSKLIKDLGAESIDFLDISYELEKRFKQEVNFKDVIKMSFGQAPAVGNDISLENIVDYLDTAQKK